MAWTLGCGVSGHSAACEACEHMCAALGMLRNEWAREHIERSLWFRPRRAWRQTMPGEITRSPNNARLPLRAAPFAPASAHVVQLTRVGCAHELVDPLLGVGRVGWLNKDADLGVVQVVALCALLDERMDVELASAGGYSGLGRRAPSAYRRGERGGGGVCRPGGRGPEAGAQ